MEIRRLTRDGITEPVSRDQILRRERRQKIFKFVLSRVLLMAYSSILLEYVLDSTYS